MAKDVITTYSTGATIYFVIYSGDAMVWNGSSFESEDNSRWLTYINTMSETSNGIYLGHFPMIPVAGLYRITAYLKIGSTPDSSDQEVKEGVMNWTGSEEYGSTTFVQYSLGSGVEKNESNFESGIENSGFDLTAGVE